MAALVWWYASTDQLYYVVGVEEPWSSTLGPALSALSAGLLIAIAFSLVDSAAGMIAAAVAAVVILALPGFLPVHHDSLSGPPLAAITLMVFGMMLHAPRWSIAYGALAAIAAVYVSPAAIGLPLAALAWAALGPRENGNGIGRRVGLAVVPMALIWAVAQWTGEGWPEGIQLGWRGGLDVGLQAAGTVLGDQIAPTLNAPALRWFAIADLTLLGIAVAVFAWRSQRELPDHRRPRKFLAAAFVVVAGLGLGLMADWLFVPTSPIPSVETVLPIAVLTAMVVVVSVAVSWSRWPRWGRALVVVLALGWFQAAVRV